MLKLDYIEKNQYSFDVGCWFNISKNINYYLSLDNNFIRKYNQQLIWWVLYEYMPLTIPFVDEIKDTISWKSLSQADLSEDFIDYFIDYIDWYHFTAAFCNRTKNKYRKLYLTTEAPLTTLNYFKKELNLIRKYKNNLNWYKLSRNFWVNTTKIEKIFAKEFADYLCWKTISFYPHDCDFLIEFKDKIDWVSYVYHSNLDSFMLDRLIQDEIIDKDLMYLIANIQKLDEPFIRKHINLFDLEKLYICQPHLTEKFVSEFIKEIDLDVIIERKTFLGQKVSGDFLLKHKNLITDKTIPIILKNYASKNDHEIPEFLGHQLPLDINIDTIIDVLLKTKTKNKLPYSTSKLTYDIYSLKHYNFNYPTNTKKYFCISERNDEICKENVTFATRTLKKNFKNLYDALVLTGKLDLKYSGRTNKEIEEAKTNIGKLSAKISNELGFKPPIPISFIENTKHKHKIFHIGFTIESNSEWLRSKATVSLLSVIIHQILMYPMARDPLSLKDFVRYINLKQFPTVSWSTIKKLLVEKRDVELEMNPNINGLATFLKKTIDLDLCSNTNI